MLVLSRKRGELVRIGDDVTIRVLSVESGRIRIGIDAPLGTGIWRGELAEGGTAGKSGAPRAKGRRETVGAT
jgi:carbon storage regulator